MLQNRVVLCGDSCVGKSSLVNCIHGTSFIEDYKPTNIVNFVSYEVPIDQENQNVVNLWDLCGQKSLKDQLEFYFKNVDVVVFMFDSTNLNSFESLNFWISSADTNDALTKATYVVVASKIDLPERAVQKDQAEAWAQMHRAEYYEISSKTQEGIDQLLSRFSQLCIEKQKQRMEDIKNPPVTTQIVQNEEPASRGWCC